jgi:hypothetical protein
MLEIEEFYLDKLVLRQVKRQEAQAAAELEDDLVDVVPATQRNNSRDNDSGLVDDDKLSRGPSRARVPKAPVSEDDDQDSDKPGGIFSMISIAYHPSTEPSSLNTRATQRKVFLAR